MADLSALIADLGRISSGADPAARRALGRTVDAMASDAQSIARSTWTRHTESADRIRGRNSRSELAAFVISDGRGGVFQERGTVNHPPQPAVQPAFERHRDQTLTSEVDAAVGRMLR